MAGGGVEFRANANGLVIVFGDDDDFNSIYEQIEKKLDSGGYFFHTRYFAATYRGRKLDPAEERIISKMMADKTGAKTVVFEIDPNYEPPRAKQAQAKGGQATRTPRAARTAQGARGDQAARGALGERGDQAARGVHGAPYAQTRQSPRIQAQVPHAAQAAQATQAAPDERLTKYIYASLRPDQSVRYDGDVVIVGDVRAGAKVVATGSVIVLGLISGAVLAGTKGDTNATVISLGFASPHIRIAGISSESYSSRDQEARTWPEMARIEGGEVVFEPLAERQISPLAL